MPVHMFVVESVVDSAMGGDSVRDVLPLVRMYFLEHSQSGDLDRHMECKSRSDVIQALGRFADWAADKAPDEPKWLWLSLHGKAPANPHHLGTKGVTAGFRKDDEVDAAEIVDWSNVFQDVRGMCPPNVVMVMDVCWGGSPSAPSRISTKTDTPALMFGPLRAAHRIELNTAAAVIAAAMSSGKVPSLEEAEEIVSSLNRWFPRDPVTQKDFYSVWHWENGRPRCFPKPQGGIVRATLASLSQVD
jgi:hypothetical protein